MGVYLIKVINEKTILKPPPTPVPEPAPSEAQGIENTITNSVGSIESLKMRQSEPENPHGSTERDTTTSTRTIAEPDKRPLERN